MQHSTYISSTQKTLMPQCFFPHFYCGWKSSRLSQLPGLWLTAAYSQDGSVAGWALQHYTGGLWELCSGRVKLQHRARCETAPSSAQSLLLCRRLSAFRAGSDEKARGGRTWVPAGFILDVSCDNNTGSLLSNSNRETLVKICLSQDLILNKLPWSFLYCNILFGKSWDCWVNSILQCQYVCTYRLFRKTQMKKTLWNWFVC